MAKVPKILADLAERRGFTARVLASEVLAPTLTRITFTSDYFRDHALSPCDVTSFRIAPDDFRHYTPESVDTDSGTATMLIHRHDDSDAPGTAMLDSLRPGDELTWCGMTSARNFRWTSPANAVAIGDTSTLGLLVAMTRRAKQEDARFLAVAEVDPCALPYARELLPGSVVLAANSTPGAAVDDWLSTSQPKLDEVAQATVYLAGHGQSIQRQRDALRNRGFDRKAIKTQPYWATGKVGL
ncbi:NADPH-dependent ferric siderophore reductase [Antricoccus suffuscus]|uniref:NADPH-dependent ferric siderophore reductase n=1 Tax=Antricoccus suffuscus TaxID=1629062 RepID=A0A2T1A1T7_9ACTN|nr:hypothetical protein [Antricoccus suffuscus]PRZ42457.1 NADPH-dependent ferric siderophore reductase [Antricoccus suffuscus]